MISMSYTTKDAFMKAYKLVEKVTKNQSLEALLLCQKVLGMDKTEILAKVPKITKEQYKAVVALSKKRATGYPLQYLMEEWEFYGRDFLVGEGVLIPRADTETLIEVLLDYSKTAPLPINILDLCSGSGCIAITLNKEIENTNVYALEYSKKAVEFLKKNVEKNSAKVNIIEADALQYKTNKQFDIIVSNPPYLSKEDMDNLQKEVTYEPEMALAGGEDGLDFYRELTKIWTKRLAKGGILAYEVGQGQADAVVKILEEENASNKCLQNICKVPDLCGIMRVVYGIKI